MGVYSDLNETQIDVMREIGNIGAGNACTALSILLNTPIDMSVPRVQLLDVAGTSDYLGVSDSEVLGVRISIDGEFSGMMYHIINRKFTQRIISTFYPKELKSFGDVDEMDMSVISEMGNITCGAYASALANLSEFKVSIGTPEPSGHTVEEILKSAIDTYGEGEEILVIDEQLVINEEALKTNIILVLERSSLEKLLERLGVTA